MENEIWKDVPGYSGQYAVSNKGRVKSLTRTVPSKHGCRRPIKERILKPQTTSKGYKWVLLCRDGKNHIHAQIHRCVALAFIPNPENKPNIDQIDGNPSNNRIENLRWCTQKENGNNPITKIRISLSKQGIKNPQYGKRNEQIKNSRKIACYNKNGELICIYPSIAEATRKTGINQSNISTCAIGKRNYASGYIWKYV